MTCPSSHQNTKDQGPHFKSSWWKRLLTDFAQALGVGFSSSVKLESSKRFLHLYNERSLLWLVRDTEWAPVSYRHDLHLVTRGQVEGMSLSEIRVNKEQKDGVTFYSKKRKVWVGSVRPGLIRPCSWAGLSLWPSLRESAAAWHFLGPHSSISLQSPAFLLNSPWQQFLPYPLKLLIMTEAWQKWRSSKTVILQPY